MSLVQFSIRSRGWDFLLSGGHINPRHHSPHGISPWSPSLISWSFIFSLIERALLVASYFAGFSLHLQDLILGKKTRVLAGNTLAGLRFLRQIP